MSDGQDEHEDYEEEFEPLVDRLRHLKWPEVPSDVRERCWQDFQQMMSDSGLIPSGGSPVGESSGEDL
jgi:hypothetical protein